MSHSKPLIGYNLLLKENVLTRTEPLSIKLKQVGCQVVKVWIPINIQRFLKAMITEGGIFLFCDSVLQAPARENFTIILDPWFRTTDEFRPPDFTDEMAIMRKNGEGRIYPPFFILAYKNS